jgi:subtilisin family serine protease
VAGFALVIALVTVLAQIGLSSGQAATLEPEPSGTLPGVAAGFKPGEVLVRFERGIAGSSRDALLARFGAVRTGTVYGLDVEVWQVPEGQELPIIKELSGQPLVEFAQPNYLYHILALPNDPDFTKQWAHSIVRSTAAWDITTGSSSITVAIIDTGIDGSHPDLASRTVAGYDFVDNDSNPRDLNGHGTHVAGIAAAVTNNATGVAGMDWQARIMPVRVLDAEGAGYTSYVAAGVSWAYGHGAKALNLSLATSYDDPTLELAVGNAHTSGSLVVAAMGNCRYYDPPECPTSNPTMYPAGYTTDVMAVAATDPADGYAPYSQYGPHCDIAAPGGTLGYYHDPSGIYSTMPTYAVYLTQPPYGYSQNYDHMQGTSMAAPYVAGLASLVWSLDPSLTPDEVQTIIEVTAVDLGTYGWDSTYGHGRIDAQAALRAVVPPAAPTLSPIANPDGDGTYLVDWSDLPSASSYMLQEDSNSTFGSPDAVYAGPAGQFQVTGHAAGTWFYRVRASNGAGDSPWSSTQAVAVEPSAPVLDPIDNPSNGDEYLVSWSAPLGAAGYRLEEDDNSSFTSPSTRYDGSDLQYAITGQPAGNWYYRVLAYNPAGDSPWSNTAGTTVAPRALDAPILSAIVNSDGDGNYLVDWSNVSGATGYALEQSSGPYFAHPVEVYAGSASQFSVSGQPGGTWYYRARASGPGGSGPWSNPQSTVVTSYIYLPLALRNYVPPLVAEGFESGTMPPARWELWTTNPSETWKIWTFYPYPYEGLYSAVCQFDEGTQNEVLVSPAFQASTAEVGFYSYGSPVMCRDLFDDCDLNVWVVFGDWDWGQGDDLMVYTADQDWTGDFVWSPSIVDLTPYLTPGTPVRLAFQYYGRDADDIGLDAIRVTGH